MKYGFIYIFQKLILDTHTKGKHRKQISRKNKVLASGTIPKATSKIFGIFFSILFPFRAELSHVDNISIENHNLLLATSPLILFWAIST